jgi:hypothetical protein
MVFLRILILIRLINFNFLMTLFRYFSKLKLFSRSFPTFFETSQEPSNSHQYNHK